jgi:FkbM family methyltransferase
MEKENIILHENRYGQKIWIDVRESIGQAIIKKGIYDENAIYYIEKILQAMPDSICLDIGANIGNHALVMSKFCKMVYCFEPQQEALVLLNKTKAINQLNNLKIFPVALSDKDEELVFYKNKEGHGGSSTFVADLKAHHCVTENLICVIGDDLLQNNDIHKIDFIKIDVEGFEPHVLKGLEKSILKSRPIIMMEWNNKTTKQQFAENDLFNNLFQQYEIKAIANNHHKYYWGRKWYSQILRFVYRKFSKKRRVVMNFFPELDYTNILLIPVERRHYII